MFDFEKESDDAEESLSYLEAMSNWLFDFGATRGFHLEIREEVYRHENIVFQ